MSQDNRARLPRTERNKPRKGRGGRIVGRILLCLFTVVLAVVACLVGIIYIFEKGPSKACRDIFVVTVTQTSAAKFTARMFLSQEEVDAINAAANLSDEGKTLDTELVTVGGGDPEEFDPDAVTIEDISGSTYKGKVMIVNDPSRVYVYSIPSYAAERGMRVQQMVEAENALAGVNGGGFEDAGGHGKGATPLGIVVSNGVWRNGSKTAKHRVIGFDNDNKLIVGTMTGQQAIDLGIRDAVAWGPVLVLNGEAMDVDSSGGGLNPRTAIGQRADGAVILVVIDGRQPNSMGASYQDLIDVMMRYGAVNAANLDGGNSSSLVYEDEVITNVYSLWGERALPTAFLVRRR